MAIYVLCWGTTGEYKNLEGNTTNKWVDNISLSMTIAQEVMFHAFHTQCYVFSHQRSFFHLRSWMSLPCLMEKGTLGHSCFWFGKQKHITFPLEKLLNIKFDQHSLCTAYTLLDLVFALYSSLITWICMLSRV